MTDYIKREDAVVYPLSWEHYDKKNGNRHFIAGVESYREYIESIPSADVVSREAYDQIKWERDTAIAQLEELGYGLGEEIRHD